MQVVVQVSTWFVQAGFVVSQPAGFARRAAKRARFVLAVINPAHVFSHGRLLGTWL